jgi:hypothetical protein
MGEVSAAAAPADCGAHRFILQVRDPVTDCPILEARVSIDDLDALRGVLRFQDGEDPDFSGIYELDGEDLDALQRLTGLPFPRDLGPVQIVPWSGLREVPYLIHTEYELALMLEGRKPLAVFADAYPADWFDEWMARFDPYVADGRLVRRIVDRPFPKPRTSDGERFDGIRHVYVALPVEQWRIDAYIQLFDDSGRDGWGEVQERRQGLLLGYEEWQCDWWETYRTGLRKAG